MKSKASAGFNKFIEIAVILAIIVFPFVNVNVGIDFGDEGYALSNAASVFSKVGVDVIPTYLASLAGGIFMMLPGGATLLGARVYCSLIAVASGLVLYFTLGKKFSKLLVGLGIIFAIMASWCPYVVLYNHLSYLLSFIALALLIKGVETKKPVLFFMAGLVLGINVFVRIPNVIYAIWIIPVIFALKVEKEEKPFKTILLCIGGFFTGVLLATLLVLCTSGVQSFKAGIGRLFTMTSNEEGYGLSDMLFSMWKVMFLNYGKWLGLIVAAMVIGTVLEMFVKNRVAKLLTSALAALVAALSVRMMHYYGLINLKDFSNTTSTLGIVSFWILFGLMICIYTAIDKRRTTIERMLALCVICYIPFAGLGTNTGLLAVSNNLMLILPVVFALTYTYVFDKYPAITVKGRVSRFTTISFVFVIMFAVSFIGFSKFNFDYVYGAEVRANETVKITEKGKLEGVFTVPGMSPIVNEFLYFYDSNDLKEKPLIAYGNIPITYFLTDSKPALSSTWVDLESFDFETFDKDMAALTIKPVIVINRWFAGADIFNEEVQSILPKSKTLADYIEDNNYSKTFENDKFVIYEP